MVRGSVVPGWTPPKKKEEPAKAQEGTYPAAILQQAQDYDELMNRYKTSADTKDPNIANLAAQYQQLISNPNMYRNAHTDRALENLGGLATSGGYSEADKSNLRSRGVSPIRAVYQNAMQDVTRQKALQGGYSPNYTASMTKLARDLSDSISSGVQNVNAGIAQNVAGNRLSAAPNYANASIADTNAMNVNKMGALGALANLYGSQANVKDNALEGMRSLYGTTPALPALYGQQAATNTSLQQQEPAPIKKPPVGFPIIHH